MEDIADNRERTAWFRGPNLTLSVANVKRTPVRTRLRDRAATGNCDRRLVKDEDRLPELYLCRVDG